MVTFIRCPGRIRTHANGTRIRCATVTPQDIALNCGAKLLLFSKPPKLFQEKNRILPFFCIIFVSFVSSLRVGFLFFCSQENIHYLCGKFEIMRVKDITAAIEAFAPLYLQESWDNSGMQVGDPESEVTGVLLCTDVREEIVDEALERGANMIISHHPLLFRGLKKITGRSYQERIVARAIKHDIAIYCAHTNMDSAVGGVNFKMAEKLGMTNAQVLDPQQGTQRKIIVFAPIEASAQVEKAMCDAGAGHLGNYDNCSYTMNGTGHYRPLNGAEPWAGEVGETHSEPEVRIEVLVNKALCGRVVAAMLKAHPYEEPAFDIIDLENTDKYAGLGVIGDVEPQDAQQFLEKVKQAFEVKSMRYSGNLNRKVSRIAMCGGAGAEFIGLAMAQGADLYITGDMKYHEFQGNEDRIILADIGHYESEHYTKEIFYDIITKKNPNFAVDFATNEKNQVNYL